MIISFFDKENEVILNIPKKNITDKERIKLLPEFLKEIQIKMNHLEEDNKKLKNEYKNMGENSISGMGGDDEFFGERKNKVGKGIKKKIIKKWIFSFNKFYIWYYFSIIILLIIIT